MAEKTDADIKIIADTTNADITEGINTEQENGYKQELVNELTEDITTEVNNEDGKKFTTQDISGEVINALEENEDVPENLQRLQELLESIGVTIKGRSIGEMYKYYRSLSPAERRRIGFRTNFAFYREVFSLQVAGAGAALAVLEPTRLLGATLGPAMIGWGIRNSRFLSEIVGEENFDRVTDFLRDLIAERREGEKEEDDGSDGGDDGDDGDGDGGGTDTVDAGQKGSDEQSTSTGGAADVGG